MMNSNTSHERDTIMDIVKGLGIIYVVLGHTLVNPMHDFIYLFHMPLFYFVSGYLYDDNYSLKPLSLIKSRLRTLYIPFLKYELVFLLFHNVFFYLNIYNENVPSIYDSMKIYNNIDYIKNFLKIITFNGTEQLLGAFWFFTVLFTINIMFCLIKYFFQKAFKTDRELPSAMVIIILYLTGIIINHQEIVLKRGFHVSLIAIMPFYLGFLYRKIRTKVDLKPGYSALGISILCFGTLFSKSPFLMSVYTKPFMYIIFSLSGIYINLFLGKIISVRKNDALIFIGKNTIVIMALHFLSFKVVNYIQIHLYDYPLSMLAKFPVLYANNGWWILYTLAGVCIPLIAKQLYLSLSPYIKKGSY